jgi:subtilisin family serine protease
VNVSVAADGERSYRVNSASGSLNQSFHGFSGEAGTYVIPSGLDLDKVDTLFFNIDYLIDEGFSQRGELPVIIVAKDAADLPALNRILNELGAEIGYQSEALAIVAASLPYEEVGRIAQALLGAAATKKIWLDRVVHASLDVSVPLIGAPEVWNSGYDGSGTIIAILDTGVDATHPDLDDLDDDPATDDPKVLFARDFSGDGTSNDLHSHGTHVAGITSGTNDEFTGVAPGAHLWNLKVLDRNGSGGSAGIIEAVMYAAEGADGQPNTGDEADVANMSLGGFASSDEDPMTLAVDYASENGVVFAIAMGNSGPSMFTIGTPGTARTAISVAASDDSDQIAGFSSRGPTPGLKLKPDVTAPGVDIKSTVPGGGYDSYSGTSMAAPHVAGAAALVIQAHPEWNVAMVKAALMNHSIILSGNQLWDQGAGRISLPESVSAPLLAVPSSLSYGLLTTGESASSTVVLSNHSGKVMNVNLSAITTVDGSTTEVVSVEPTTLTLDADGTTTIAFDVGPIGDEVEGWYEGRIHIEFTEDASSTAGVMDASSTMGVMTVPYLFKLEQFGEIEVSPDSFDEDVLQFVTKTTTLQIDNVGAGELSYSVGANETGQTASSAVDSRSNSNAIPIYPIPLGASLDFIDEQIKAAFGEAEIQSSPDWLCFEPSSGALQASEGQAVTVTLNCDRSLEVGTHEAMIVIESDDPDEGTIQVPLTLTVGEGIPPDVEVTPENFEEEITAGQALTATMTISNPSSSEAAGVLRFDLSTVDLSTNESATWMTTNPTSGLVDPDSSVEIQIRLNGNGVDLEQGENRRVVEGQVFVDSNDPVDPRVSVAVQMTLLAPNIGVEPETLEVGLGEGESATRVVTVSNSGEGTLAFDIGVRETSRPPEADGGAQPNPASLSTPRGTSGYSFAGKARTLAVNDLFPGTAIQDLPFSDDVDTSEAGMEDNEPLCVNVGKTVWYEINLQQDRLLTANTFGSGFDTILAAYTGGDDLASLESVACNDDTDGLQSEIKFMAVAGQNYYLQVGGYGGDSGSLSLTLEVQPPVTGVDLLSAHLYAITGPTTIWRVDPRSGSVEIISTPEGASMAADGLAANREFIFFLNAQGSNRIFKMDHDGVVVAIFDAPSDGVIDGLAFGDGVLYAQDSDNDEIISIDPDSGAVLGSVTVDRNLIGGLGAGPAGTVFGVSAFQEVVQIDTSTGEVLGVAFADSNRRIYGLAFDGESLVVGFGETMGHVIVNPVSGEIIGEIGVLPAVSGLAIGAVGPSWLRVEPVTGQIEAGQSLDVTVTIDATGLERGAYSADIVFMSNDPRTPDLVVPVSLGIQMSRAVGTITLQGQTDHRGIAVQFEGPVTASAVTDPHGRFSVWLSPGSYNASTSYSYHLPASVDFDLASGATRTISAQLLFGDANNDGYIDILDLIRIAVNLGLSESPGDVLG